MGTFKVALRSPKWRLSLVLFSVFALSGCGSNQDSSSASNTDFSSDFIDNSGSSSTSVSSSEPHKNPRKTPLNFTYNEYGDNYIDERDYTSGIGDMKLLVIPLWFTDSTNFIARESRGTIKEDINLAYFGTPEETGWHSVASYYETESQGQCRISGKVADWFELDGGCAKYGSRNNTFDDVVRLVQEACDWYFDISGDDPKNFDGDNNGYIDGIVLIPAAPDYHTLDDPDLFFWAWSGWIAQEGLKNKNCPGPNSFTIVPYDFLYSEDLGYEKSGGVYAAGAGDTRFCNVDAHMFIHEVGHLFGLDDYYDYGPSGYKPAGCFSMQDYNLGGHDPFSMMAIGWVDPYIPKESCEIHLKPFQQDNEVILLTPSWNENDSPFDEYLLLELYTPTGLNEFDTIHENSTRGIRGADLTGIRLWHVDARLAYYTDIEKEASIDRLTTNPLDGRATGGIQMAFSNSYDIYSYGSVLGPDYYRYNVLELLRKNAKKGTPYSTEFADGDLFVDGTSFDMTSYSNHFYQSGKLNSGLDLGWTFSVTITGEGDNALAIINVNKSN